MYGKVTYEQLYQEFTTEMLEACGYTQEVLERAEMDKVRLIDVTIPLPGFPDVPEEIEPGIYKVSLSISGPQWLPDLKATSRPTPDQVDLWRGFGIEIIE